MAAPVFNFSESNGATPTITNSVTSIVFASADTQSNSSNLATTSPITAGNNSYEKWERLQITTVASNSVSAFGVYFSATAPTDQAGSSSFITMYFATNATFSTPATTTSVATTLCSSDTSAGGTAFTAPANTANSYSGYMTFQMRTTSSATGGNVTFPSPWCTVQYTYN
jgi:hypothetical protein